MTGGNPKMLSQLYEAYWNVDDVVNRLIKERNITPQFIARWRNWLERAINDPDTLWESNAPEDLINKSSPSTPP